jgi:hypothetical protein
MAPGHVMKSGYVWRDGQIHRVIASEVVVQLESDALTPRAGEAKLELDTGETLWLRCERSDAIVLHVRGLTAVETIGRVYLGEREGVANLEVSTNAAGGILPPVFTIGSNSLQGLSRRP